MSKAKVVDPEKMNSIIEALEDLLTDSTVPKNIKNGIQRVIGILNQKAEICLKVNKALHEFDEMCDDINIQPYTRTQLWNIISMLESI